MTVPDIGSQAFLSDLPAGTAALRAHGPVVRTRIPLLGPIWLTTTHAATQSVLKRPELFAMRTPGKRQAGTQWWMPPSVRVLADNMLGHDGAEHRALRSRVDRAFARRGIAAMEGEVAAQADRMLGAFRNGETIDLVSAFARRLPAYVIAELLGLTDAQREAFLRRALRFADTSRSLQFAWSLLRTGAFVRLIREMVREAKRAPRDGLLGALVSDPDPLSEDAMVSMVFLLMFAGFETTTNLISGSVLALHRHPEARAAWLADPQLRGVEELVRHVSAVTGSKPRIATEDAQVESVSVARGEMVMALPVCANYDPAVFSAPDRLDMDRLPNPHLGFGAGPHFCLGNQLARLELRVALERLHARFPGWRVADADPAYYKRPGHRAIKALPAELRA